MRNFVKNLDRIFMLRYVIKYILIMAILSYILFPSGLDKAERYFPKLLISKEINWDMPLGHGIPGLGLN